MRSFLFAVSLSLAALAASCASGSSAACCSSGGCEAQSVVDEVAQANPGVTRLTVHCKQADGTAMACASTMAEKKGKASDPEDLRAMSTGEAVVLAEATGLDVTVPIRSKDGKFQSACGVTFAQKDMDHKAAVAQATAIAKVVEAKLAEKCGDCCGK